MTNECAVVKDLLPLYAENMTSGDTAAFIKTHLDGCESCRAALKALEAPVPVDEPGPEAAVPLKQVKKKLTIKKALIAAVAALAALVIAVVGAVIFFEARPMHQVLIAAGNSELYTQEEIDAAVDAVLADFENLEGCKLYSLTFAGDEKCLAERDYVNEFGEYTDCIVFNSTFRSPLFGGGGWNAHELYYWQWYLGRSPDGTWRVVAKGYA